MKIRGTTRRTSATAPRTALWLITLITLCPLCAEAGPPRRRPGARPHAQTKAASKPTTTVEPTLAQPIHDLFAEPSIPSGFTGKVTQPAKSLQHPVVALPDRWRIGWPSWDRYARQTDADRLWMNTAGGDSPYTPGHPLNPYNQNLLKGDYPIAQTADAGDIFLNVTAVSDTLFNCRKLPTPSGISALSSGSFDFFGDGKQAFVSQIFAVNIDLFKGYTSFRPVDWLLRVTPVVNINYLELNEKNNVDVDVRNDQTRRDNFTTLQEAFFEYHLGDTSHAFDFMAVRIGRQRFNSDFRGFLYNDIGDGVRLFGNLLSNRVQYSVAFFNQNDKDTNSGLNEFYWKQQQIFIANAYIQDFIWMGYTTQFSFHWNHDESDRNFDDNGFLVIPDLVGSANLHKLDVYYLGWTSDGHIGRLNVNHAFYYAFGSDDANPIAGRAQDIQAYLGAVELSVDIDWLRPKVSFLYASGDDDPTDGQARGFDGILDNPFFAGGPSSFYQSQALRLFGVNLVSSRSFYNDLAASKDEGQSNFVNPGTILFNAGLDAEITPKLRASFNYNRIWFVQTESLELLLNQNAIPSHVGDEANLLLQYRPFLNNNVIITVGGSLFFPGDGFEALFSSDKTLYEFFTGLTLTY